MAKSRYSHVVFLYVLPCHTLATFWQQMMRDIEDALKDQVASEPQKSPRTYEEAATFVRCYLSFK